jgi:hypothetical protein
LHALPVEELVGSREEAFTGGRPGDLPVAHGWILSD